MRYEQFGQSTGPLPLTSRADHTPVGRPHPQEVPVKFPSRGLTILAGGVAVAAVALSASALTSSAGAQSPTFTPSCSQKVAKGQFTCFALKRTDLKQPKVLA